MNPIFKEYVIDFADLKLISIVCKKCKTETIIEVTSELRNFPNVCQSCGNVINEVFIEAITSYYKIYNFLAGKNLGALARVRLRQEANMSEL
jgi:hypothetical protein